LLLSQSDLFKKSINGYSFSHGLQFQATPVVLGACLFKQYSFVSEKSRSKNRI
jgi:hypothetical protein